MRTSVVVRAAIGALALGVGGFATPATAASSPGQATPSLNRAGYVVRTDAVKVVKLRWVQPAADCAKGASFANVRVGFARSRHEVAVGTSLACHGGQPSYDAWMNFGDGPERLDETVRAGDVITATLTASKHSLSLEIDDPTSGWGEGAVTGGPRDVHMTRAFFGVTARAGDSGVLPLADFGKAVFTDATVNGQPVGDAGAQAVLMQSQAGVVKAVPGDVRNGKAFTVTWQHS
jgi:hypothetical protein